MESRQGSTKDVFLTAILLCLVLLLVVIFRSNTIERTVSYQMAGEEQSSDTEDYQLDEFSYLIVLV